MIHRLEIRPYYQFDLSLVSQFGQLSLVSKAVRQALKGMSCLYSGDRLGGSGSPPRFIKDFDLRVVEYWCRSCDLKWIQRWSHTLKRITVDSFLVSGIIFHDILMTLGSVSQLESVSLTLSGEFDANYVLDVSMLPKSLEHLDLTLYKVSLQGIKYPESLRKLELMECQKLEFLNFPPTLQNLTIHFFRGGLDPFPNKLTHLRIFSCKSLDVLCLPPSTKEITILYSEIGKLVFNGCRPTLIVLQENDIGQIIAANGAIVPEYLTLWPEYSEHEFVFGAATLGFWGRINYKAYGYMSIFSENNSPKAITLADILSSDFAKNKFSKESSNFL